MLDRLLISSSARAIDPQFRNVTLLLHGDGSNGAQNNTFLDSSSNNFTVTRNGNTTQGSFSPYGTRWSNYFDGSGDYLTVPNNAALDVAAGDFTMEFWMWKNSTYGVSGSTFQVIMTSPTAVGSSYEIQTHGPTNTFALGINGVGNIVSYATSNFAPYVWYHVVFTRSGNAFRMFVNGVLVSYATNSINFTSGNGLAIGGLSSGRHWDGNISDLRLIKGSIPSAYQASSTTIGATIFTPPTAPLTAITNTSLLTCQSNRFRDASTNNFTITRNGDTRVSPFSPYAPSSAYSAAANGGSMYFDGSGDYCRIASAQTALQFSTGDFTAEGWVYSTNGTGSFQHILTGGSSWTTNSGGIYWYYNGGSPYIGAAWNHVSPNPAVASSTLAVNAWHHFALVRSGNTLSLYVNGTSVSTLNVAGVSLALNNQSQTNIGGGGWDNDFAGLLSNVRVVKGTAVYTSNFTPPTAPVTAISNTQLLLNGTNAAIVDSAADNDLETVGNAQISTSVKKFGTGSIYFDGSGDWLALPSSPDLEFGSGNLTIEGWFNTTTSTPYCTLFSRETGGFGAGSYGLFVNGGSADGVLQFWCNEYSTGSPLLIAGSGNTRDGAWHHFAVVRNGSAWTLFLDGVSVGTRTSSITLGTATAQIRVGANQGYSRDFAGYIDDLRITKGVARYTANFTPPAAPFPDQ